MDEFSLDTQERWVVFFMQKAMSLATRVHTEDMVPHLLEHCLISLREEIVHHAEMNQVTLNVLMTKLTEFSDRARYTQNEFAQVLRQLVSMLETRE